MFNKLEQISTTDEQKELLKNAKKIFHDMKLDFNFLKRNDIPQNLKAQLTRIIPTESSLSLAEVVQHFMGVVKTMNEDRTIYKDLRNTIDGYLNNGKFTIKYDNIDFNDDLKNSELRKTFIEYVNSNLNPNGNKEISNYSFFTNAYFSLDLLGISKEPSKKVKFRNVINDGLHSYYGAFCDYVVSDDQGLLKKTRALYRLLKIDTKVIHIEEFIGHFSLLSNSFENSQSKFFELLSNDLKNGLIISSIPSIQNDRRIITIKPYHNYLGYFNQIDIVLENNQGFIFLSRVTNNYSDFCFIENLKALLTEPSNYLVLIKI